MRDDIRQLLNEEKYNEAIIKCKELLADDSNNPDLWYSLFLSENGNYINTDFNNLHSGTKLKIPFINDSVNQILRSTESFVEDYYSKISEEMLNEIEGINFDNNANIKKEEVKEIEPLIRNNNSNIPKGIPYPGIVPPRKSYGRIK